jgi:S1-C subfamily serine protease
MRTSRLTTALASAAVGAVVARGPVARTGNPGADHDAGSPPPPAARAPPPAAAVDTPARAASVTEIYERVGKGVVFVEATRPDGRASGSGFLIDDEGRILTNQHVVEDATRVRVRFGEEGQRVNAKLLGADPNTDVALLQVDPDDLRDAKPLELGQSSKVKVGESTIAIGSPFGLEGSVSTGIVSALDREIESPNGFAIDEVIQTDAAINPGNSGGPLLDAAGRVIGINSQIATDGARANSGVGFAVPIDTARDVAEKLEQDGEIKRAYLGVSTAPVDRALAQALDLPEQNGALVQEVVDGGPADDAGLRAGSRRTAEGVIAGGDLIVQVGDVKIDEPDDIVNAIEDLKPGDDVEITFLRGDDRRTVTVELGERPARAQN